MIRLCKKWVPGDEKNVEEAYQFVFYIKIYVGSQLINILIEK